MTDTPDLLAERRGPVLWLTLNREARRNALTANGEPFGRRRCSIRIGANRSVATVDVRRLTDLVDQIVELEPLGRTYRALGSTQ